MFYFCFHLFRSAFSLCSAHMEHLEEEAVASSSWNSQLPSHPEDSGRHHKTSRRSRSRSRSRSRRRKKRHRRRTSSSDASSTGSSDRRRKKRRKKHKRHRSRSASRERHRSPEPKRERFCTQCCSPLVQNERRLWFCTYCPPKNARAPPGGAPPSAAAAAGIAMEDPAVAEVHARTVFMGNCPDCITKDAVHREFGDSVAKVDLFFAKKATSERPLKNVGFVTFKEKAAADAAVARQFITIDGYLIRLKAYESRHQTSSQDSDLKADCCFNCGGSHHLSYCPHPLKCSFCQKEGHTFHVCPRRLTAHRGLQIGIAQHAPISGLMP